MFCLSPVGTHPCTSTVAAVQKARSLAEIWKRPNAPSCRDALIQVPPLDADTLERFAGIIRGWGPALLRGSPPRATAAQDLDLLVTTLDRWNFSWKEAMGMLNMSGGGSAFRHTSHKVTDCVRMSTFLTGGPASLVAAVAQSLATVLPEFLRELFIKHITKPRSHMANILPSASLLQRYEIALDTALMLLARERASGECIRVGWSDSSLLAGYDWIWSQYHEIDQRKVLQTFKAVRSLRHAVCAFVNNVEQLREEAGADLDDAADAATQEWPTNPQPEWVPWLQCLKGNIFERINPPAAMGSGHRGLADKAACEVYKWHLQSPVEADLGKHSLSYIARCSDMGVEQPSRFSCEAFRGQFASRLVRPRARLGHRFQPGGGTSRCSNL